LGALIPLYLVDELRGSLIDLGLMSSISTMTVIPASIYLGRLPDRYGRSKPFILGAFLGVSLILFCMPTVTSVTIFQILYVLMSLVNYVVGPSTSVLIAESFERSRWGTAVARQSFVEGMAQATGLAVCSFMINRFGYVTLLRLAGPLVFSAFVLGFLTIRDPPMHVERLLSRFERPVDNIETLSFHLTSSGISPTRREKLQLGREPSMAFLGLSMIIFSFAANNAFTSLSIYLRERVMLPTSTIFTILLIRSLFGTASYLIVGRIVGSSGGGAARLAVAMRIILVLLLPMVAALPQPFSLVGIVAVLSAIAFSFSIYAVGMEIVKVAYAAPGSLGVYDALSSLGGATGSFSGGLIPTLFGFEMLYLISAGFFASCLFVLNMALR